MKNHTDNKIVTIFYQFNPFGDKVGGVGKYVLSFIKNAPSSCNIKLVGIGREKSALYKWVKINIDGKVIDFLPVCVVLDENTRGLIPTTFAYVWGLLRSRLKSVEFNGALFMQRAEYAIPFFGAAKNKYLVIHTDLEQELDSKGSEVIWAKCPKIFKFLLKVLLKEFNHIFSVNSNSIEFISETFPREKDKLSFSPTWAEKEYFFRPDESKVKSDRLNILKELNLDRYVKIVIFVGRFQKPKNIELLIRAISSLDDVFLIMAGDGNERISIEKLISSQNIIGKVKMLGNVNHSDLPKYIYSSDAYVSSSNFEGMSVALLEALQVGTPVITTPTGESKKIIDNGVNGIVTNGWEVDEFSASIMNVLSFDHDVVKSCLASVAPFVADCIIKNMLNTMVEKSEEC